MNFGVIAAGLVLTSLASTCADASSAPRATIVAIPDQPTALLDLTIGVDGVGRDCKVLRSSGDEAGEALACRYFSRGGHEIRNDATGHPVEYHKKVGVARSFLLQIEQAQQ